MDNWLRVYKARPATWKAHIPKESLDKINECLIEIASKWYWIRCPAAAKAMLLKGAQTEYKDSSLYLTSFATCILNGGSLDLAEIRNLFWVDCFSR